MQDIIILTLAGYGHDHDYTFCVERHAEAARSFISPQTAQDLAVQHGIIVTRRHGRGRCWQCGLDAARNRAVARLRRGRR